MNVYCFAAVPGEPGIPYISDCTDTTLNLKWEPPTDDGGSPITEYVIEMHETRSSSWRKVNTTTGDTETQVTELTGGTELEFRVTAKNKVGPSKPGNVSKKVTTCSK